MRKYLVSFVFSAAALLASATISLAADWTVQRSSGEVWIGSNGAQPASLGKGMTLTTGGIVTTGNSGRVFLVRGDQSMTIGPNSVVGVPDDNLGSAFTTILQRTGVVEYNVDKRQVKHFAVETPFLAAVVKGTNFVVRANRSSGAVKVARGRVEVTDLATGQIVDVIAGQAATVTRAGGLKASGAGEVEGVRQGSPRSSRASDLGLAIGGSNGIAANVGSGGVSVSAGGPSGISASVSGNGVSVGGGATNVVTGLLHALGL